MSTPNGEPAFPENDREDEDKPVQCVILPPYTSHDPCGMPGCGRMTTGKWAEPIFTLEVRGLARNCAGLDNAVISFIMCTHCFSGLSALVMDTYMVEEEAAAAILDESEE